MSKNCKYAKAYYNNKEEARSPTPQSRQENSNSITSKTELNDTLSSVLLSDSLLKQENKSNNFDCPGNVSRLHQKYYKFSEHDSSSEDEVNLTLSNELSVGKVSPNNLNEDISEKVSYN